MTARSTDLVLVPGLACTEDLFAEQIATLRGRRNDRRHRARSALARPWAKAGFGRRLCWSPHGTR